MAEAAALNSWSERVCSWLWLIIFSDAPLLRASVSAISLVLSKVNAPLLSCTGAVTVVPVTVRALPTLLSLKPSFRRRSPATASWLKLLNCVPPNSGMFARCRVLALPLPDRWPATAALSSQTSERSTLAPLRLISPERVLSVRCRSTVPVPVLASMLPSSTERVMSMAICAALLAIRLPLRCESANEAVIVPAPESVAWPTISLLSRVNWVTLPFDMRMALPSF
ncbi:hypothetical protein D3C75_830660 [compost metagenome]